MEAREVAVLLHRVVSLDDHREPLGVEGADGLGEVSVAPAHGMPAAHRRESCTAQTRTLSPAFMLYLTFTTVWRLLITHVWAGGSGQVVLFDPARFFASTSTA